PCARGPRPGRARRRLRPAARVGRYAAAVGWMARAVRAGPALMRVAVGRGGVGARAARQLASTEGVEEVLLRDLDEGRRREVAASLGAVATDEPPSVTGAPEADAGVLAL